MVVGDEKPHEQRGRKLKYVQEAKLNNSYFITEEFREELLFVLFYFIYGFQDEFMDQPAKDSLRY